MMNKRIPFIIYIIYTAPKHKSNGLIHYSHLGSVPDLIRHYNGFVSYDSFTNSKIRISIANITEIFTLHYLLYNWKCPSFTWWNILNHTPLYRQYQYYDSLYKLPVTNELIIK